MKRLEATERSPLQARISETLDGIPTIMAYKRERDFENAASGLLDKSNQPTFLRFSAGTSSAISLFTRSLMLAYRDLDYDSNGDFILIGLAYSGYARPYQGRRFGHTICARHNLRIFFDLHYELVVEECRKCGI